MKRGRIDRRDKTSSALVITLLGVVLLTIIVVAFMQTMTLSLTTSKSYADIRRATLAAQAGLDTAVAQISQATGTNLAFVTGLTNYTYTSNGTNYNSSITLISAGNLTNFNQMMPLVSGNISYLTNFGNTNSPTNFAPNFTNYTSPLYPTPNSAQTVDVNTSYEFIQYTNVANGVAPTTYPATWVTMTNVVGSQTSYTRFAYVVLDDTARMNPALMTGTGTGLTNSTNWYSGNATNPYANPYAGPNDINVTLLTNSAGFQVLSASQLQTVTNSTSSNAFGYSDATLGETYPSVAAYQSNQIYLTSSTNPSFDVIPAWYSNGGMPKYNINDLAMNTNYGTNAMLRASNIACIITNNLPNFYQRDPALTAAPDTTKFLYVNRLAANIVDYISPDNGTPNSTNNFLNTDYTYSSNQTGGYAGISPQGHGVYPIFIAEQDYVVSGPPITAGTTSQVVSQFWLSCWNPFTTPVTIQSANLHVSSRPGYYLGTGITNSAPDYTSAVCMISGKNGNSGSETGPPLVNPSYVVNPNEFVVVGFAPQTNTLTSPTSTSTGPSSVSQTNNYIPSQSTNVMEQFALTVNGQTTAQSGAQSKNAPLNTSTSCGGLDFDGQTGIGPLGTGNKWNGNNIEVYGSEVADPRFESYMNNVWFTHGSQSDSYQGIGWKGVEVATGSRTFVFVYPPNGTWATGSATIGVSTWQNRDNMARDPLNAGLAAASDAVTPDTVSDEYNQSTDSNAAPEVIRNGPMVSIGELGHVFDPANANDALTALAPRWDNGGFTNPYVNGGARSLRIGRPEENGTPTTITSGSGSTTSSSWDTNGLRAINLLDLFTVNNANTNTTMSTTNTIAQNMNYGGALGRINPNTASSNVLAAVLSGIQITSDSGMTNSTGTLISPFLTNIPTMVNELITNRPYSSLSDLYKTMPMFDTNVNYSPSPTVTPYLDWNDGNYAPNSSPYLLYPATLNVFNRVHQEAFGKLVQHLTVQSRSYRIYVIGQVLDSNQNPHGSVAMVAGIYLQYNQSEKQYDPVIQYLRILK